MKPTVFVFIAGTVLFAALANPAWLSAQHTRFKFIDIGTPFGGPNSSPAPPNPDVGPARPDFALYPVRSLNKRGTFVGQAETSTHDPFDFCFNAFGDCLVSQALQWQDGDITNLGALTDGVSSAPAWISDSGLIAGVSENGEIDPLISGFPELHAVLWKRGEILDLGTLEGAHESLATAINSRGQVVGAALNTTPDSNSMLGLYETRAFLWEHGVMQDLGTLGGTDAMALLVNERGQVIGQSYTADSAPATTPFCAFFPLTQHGFLWENGKLVDIGTLGGSCTFTYDFNNKGQVVGQSATPGDPTSHPFLWDRGTITDLGTLGGNYGWANWINDTGEIAGTASPDGESLIAFSWKDGVQTGLGTLGGDPCSVADAVNSKGQVVGGSGSFGTGGFFPACETPSGEQAVLWENGRIVDLNAFVPPDSDLTLVEATSINDRGEISGFGTLPNSDVHAFLLIPCDQGTEGCRDESASETAARQGHSTLTAAQGLAIRRMMPGSRAPNAGLSQLQKFASNTISTSAPIVALSPTSLSFPTQAIDTTSSAKMVALKNTGTASLTITAIAIVGINAADFNQTHNCGSSLAAGASCRVSVTFKPTASGTRTAALSISDNAAGSPQKVSLSGIGTTAELSPRSLNFGTVALGDTSSSKAVTLTNVGTTTLTISGVAITGTNAEDFNQTHNCGTSLAAGASCRVSVTFKPTASGTRTAALSISDNAAGSPQKVTLSGIGTTAKLYPPYVNFGSVTIGTTSSPQIVTLTNVGVSTLTIIGIAISGTDPGDFAQTHTCGTSLAAGASCNITVTFKPTASGTRTAVVSISDNAAGSPQSVSLFGTGIAGRCTQYGGECGTPFTPSCCAGLTCSYCGLHNCCL